MSKKDKRMERLLSKPKDYTFDELRSLMLGLGFKEYSRGNTSGSAVRFYRESDQAAFDLDKPHPGNIIKGYLMKQLISVLKEHGDIDE